MAKASPPLLALLLIIFHILIITMVVARPAAMDKNLKKPESFFEHDRGYLIPGLGRAIKPKCKDVFNPFFNPVTGSDDGNLGHMPTFPGVGGGGGRAYVPGGDDTFVPNPGVEVPNPGNGGSSPGPTSN